MDHFIVSARKYRPSNFEDVVGQQAIANTLMRSIVNHKLAGAYLFCGPRGVGKTTCARIFAKTINCLQPKENGEACNECESCKSFNEGRSVNVQELNAAANNSVDDIRNIIDQVRIPPQLGKYKVVILDEVHMLSGSASNALLKTLEEPPSYVVFILATTEKQKIIPTILSRCQIFDFNRMGINDIVGELKMVAGREGIEYEDAALNVIAQKADGGMRDSLSIFDQVVSFTEGKVTYESVLRCLNVLDYEYYFKMTDGLLKHEVSTTMLLFNEIVSKGFNGGIFISGLASHFRDLLMCRSKDTISLLDVADSVKEHYMEQAQRCTPKFLYKAIRLCDKCGNEYKNSYNKRLSVEITLIEVSQMDDSGDEESSGLGPTKALKPIFKETNRGVSSASKATVAKPAKLQVSQNVSIQSSAKRQAAEDDVTVQSAVAAKQPVNSHTIVRPSNRPIDPKLILKQMGTVPIHNAATMPSDEGKATKKKQSVEKEKKIIGEDEFGEKELTYYWKQFVDSLPQEDKAMQGRMKGMPLRLLADCEVEITVNNEEVVKFMKPYIPIIEKFLREHLNNRNVKIKTFVMSEERQEIIFTPQKLFANMMRRNEGLAELQKKLNLKLD